MHELSIATSIVELAQQEAESRAVRVLAVHLKVGMLSGVVADALLGAWELACAGSPLEGSRLVIEEVPIVVFCPTCRERRNVSSGYFLECPECQTPTPEVLEGTELQVTALEVDP